MLKIETVRPDVKHSDERHPRVNDIKSVWSLWWNSGCAQEAFGGEEVFDRPNGDFASHTCTICGHKLVTDYWFKNLKGWTFPVHMGHYIFEHGYTPSNEFMHYVFGIKQPEIVEQEEKAMLKELIAKHGLPTE